MQTKQHSSSFHEQYTHKLYKKSFLSKYYAYKFSSYFSAVKVKVSWLFSLNMYEAGKRLEPKMTKHQLPSILSGIKDIR